MYAIFDNLHFRTEEEDFILGKIDWKYFIQITQDSLNLNSELKLLQTVCWYLKKNAELKLLLIFQAQVKTILLLNY